MQQQQSGAAFLPAGAMATTTQRSAPAAGLLPELLQRKPEIRYLLLTFLDLLGVARAKLVPAEALLQGALGDQGAGFAGFAAHFDLSPADPDMFATPDAEAHSFQLPWRPDTAWVPCDLSMRGRPLAQAPRQVLKAQIARAKAQGLAMKTGVEAEFFLLLDGGGGGAAFGGFGVDSASPRVADGRDTAAKPCYDQAALMRRIDLVALLVDYLRDLGFGPYQVDHEDGNGQFEMNWEYAPCLVTADRHAFFKFMVKSVAESRGLKATFMPKPFLNRSGNGAHCHVSLWGGNDGGAATTNLFLRNEDDDVDEHGLGLTPLAYSFMAGVLSHARPLAAIANPSVNSYKRISLSTSGSVSISGSSWAPCCVSWTGNNRTHMVRVPAPGRFELRLPDGAANPYLLQAAILACGLDGVEKSLNPGPVCDWNGHLPLPQGHPELPSLPANLLEALQELESSMLKQALGEEFVESYIKLQRQQWDSYTGHLSQWELDNTLNC